jgi:D-alanyl-D-alanine carboxypeptidase/D-alanyl-D-alanine carboxypeptidase (penicillin-binding protein 5/6)
MLMLSGNDAANAAAIAIGGSLEGFARLMNSRAREIGMLNSSFVTPSGLDAQLHYSTAYDMALLGCAAISNPEVRALCSQKSLTVYYGSPPYRRTLTGHNRLLSGYPGAIGIKTGFTKKSGRCLVSAAERGGVTLVAVTLNAPDDWADHRKLLDYGFELMESRSLSLNISGLRLSVVGGTESTVAVEAGKAPTAALRIGDREEIVQEIHIKPFEYAPVRAGELVGKVSFLRAGRLINETPLIAADDVPARPLTGKGPRLSILERIKKLLKIN